MGRIERAAAMRRLRHAGTPAGSPDSAEWDEERYERMSDERDDILCEERRHYYER